MKYRTRIKSHGSLIIALMFCSILTVTASAGDVPINSYDYIRNLLIYAPDPDFTLYDQEELFDALTWLIENDDDEKVVLNAIPTLRHTGDERSVEYILEYLDEIPMDCLHTLGWFSTPESCNALLSYVEDEDEFNRRFSAQSLGKLDYTVSKEMWELKEVVSDRLSMRMSVEEEDWVIPFLEKAILAIDTQEFDPVDLNDGLTN